MACVFETFRKDFIKSLELDPAHYISAPKYSWDVMLKFTNVNSKLISDIAKGKFIETTRRGGVSMILKGYTEANNKFIKSYDANKPTSYIIYLDTDNLYAHSMMQLLPTEILDWVNSKDFNLYHYCLIYIIIYSSAGCFLEVNLDYPDKLHDFHNYYPLVDKKTEVTKETLSDYQLQIIEDNFSPGKNKNFIHNIGNKSKYKLHYQNLKLCLN